ncbi:MAG: ABC transporter substrate-binding protein, partial [Spirulina sp.]
MKRRNFIANSAIGATTAATLAACNSTPTSSTPEGESRLPKIEWRMATSWPLSLDTIYGGATTTCDRVREMTDGRFDITPYPGGEIVGGLEVFDAVQN